MEKILITPVSALSNNRKHDNFIKKIPAAHQPELNIVLVSEFQVLESYFLCSFPNYVLLWFWFFTNTKSERKNSSTCVIFHSVLHISIYVSIYVTHRDK